MFKFVNFLIKLAMIFKVVELQEEDEVYLVKEDKSEDIFIIIRGNLYYKKDKPNQV